MNKLNSKITAKYFNKGFNLIEVIIGVTLFSIFFTSLFFGLSTIIKIEIKSKEKIYRTVKKIDELSKKYYINYEE